MSDSGSSLMCVVIDLNPLAWGLRTVLEAQNKANQNKQANGQADQRPETIVQGLDAMLTFINSFLLMTHGNKVAVVGVHPGGSEFLFPSSNDKERVTSAAQVNLEVAEKFRQILERPEFMDLASTEKPCSSRFASGLTRALCFINKKRHKNPKLSARVLVLKCGMDHLSDQYLALINAAFAAQEMNIKIDAAVIDRENTNAALQQVCSVTDGIYSQVMDPSMLLQILLVYHLADDKTRKKLSVIPQKDVDSRGTCFTSNKPVDIGYVCSVCLSVFSSFTPICSTCSSVFKMPQLANPRKRKRIK